MEQLPNSFVAQECQENDTDRLFQTGGSEDVQKFSLGPLLGSGASSCVYAVTRGLVDDSVRRASSLRDSSGFAAKFFRRDRNPQLSALEREIKTLVSLTPSPYIAGFHGQFSVKLSENCALKGVAKSLGPTKGRDLRERMEGHEEQVERISFILIDRCDFTLTSLIQKTAFAEEYAAFVMDRLLRAVAHLHAQRIVHRDIKDNNILIADSGRRVCLCDFDLAVTVPEGNETIEWKGGTPGYMAPEVCNYGKASFKADLFSAGVVLHVLLTRSNPFLPEHAGLKVQGSSPMDYDMLRLFRSEASCNLLYDLLEIDPEMRPSATESLDFPWFHELALKPLCKLLRDPNVQSDSGQASRPQCRNSGKKLSLFKTSKVDATSKSPPGSQRTTVSVTSVLSRMGSAARNIFERPSRRQSRVVPIQEFDEICLP